MNDTLPVPPVPSDRTPHEPTAAQTGQFPDTLPAGPPSAPAGGWPPAPALEAVGDYEVLGVLGRGGMGVVYKARQKSLNRIVALKMILGGALAGADEVARFKVEAEAAARLQHPNITQIYEIGQADGNPYFSLEYVEGGSLAQLLDGTPQPPRTAAHLVEILARAMHFAHSRGIVHRDLKPANILLSKSVTVVAGGDQPSPLGHAVGTRYGIPKVTDFGLAKRLDVDLQQTQTGAVLGTPSYMAPEQAAGRVHEVGPATDVYALGAILYDLLTGRPPFKSTSLADTLQQVRTIDPVPPARLQPGVPRDLETICLKCLRKEPDRRYASALAFAEDLHRYLAGEPIKARPVGVLERTVKWVRRHPAVAALIAVSAGSLVAVTAVVLSANVELREANARETKQRREAERNFHTALAAVEDMLTEVGAVDLADVPQLTPIRRRLLERAQVYYRSFLADHERDPGLVEVTARAQGHLGEVYDLLGNTPAAESAYRQVLVLLREPVKANPGTVALEAEFARAANNLGVVLKKRHHLAEAEAALREAIEHRELLRNLPEDEFRYGRELAESLYQLGTVLARQPARRAEAQDLYKQALTLQGWLEQVVPGWTDVTRDRARTLNNLGNLQRAIAPERVLPSYQQAAALQEQLVKRFPDFPGFRRELGRTYQNIAVARSRDTAAGDEFARRAIDTLHRLVLDFPSVPAYRHEEATAHRTRGQVLAQGNQPAAAEEAYRAAVAIEEKLAQEFADVPEYQQRLADVQGTLAAFLGQGSRKDEADQLFRRALTTREKLLREHPENADYHRDLSWTLNDLGFLQSDRNQLADARATFRRAVAEARRAWDADPKNAEYAGELGRITYNLARTEVDLGQPDTAAATIDELVKLQPDDPENQRRAALIFARCSQRAGADKALPEADRRRRADAYAARAVAALRAAVRQGFTDAGHLQDEEYLPLRQRPDFQELQRELTAKTEKRVT